MGKPNSTEPVLVIKIGGSTLGNHDTTLEDLVTLQREGYRPVIVHGGGNIISHWMTERGIRPRFIRGLRVTDPESLEIVTAVLAGLVNKKLVAAVTALGGKAVGLSGVDGGLLQAYVKNPLLGSVGQLAKVDPDPVLVLLNAGFLPILAPISFQLLVDNQESGQILNVNADTVAGEIAWTLGAQQLVFLTDVSGVIDRSQNVLPVLTPSEAQTLINEEVVSAGMIPKLEACLRAADRVPKSSIVDGRQPHALLNLINGNSMGTLICNRRESHVA